MTIESAFTHFPVLTTKRLILRPVQPLDAEALFTIKSDQEVTSRYGVEPHRSIADTLGWIGRLKDSYDRREALYWGLAFKDDDRLIGGCTLWNFGEDHRCAELGYELHPAYWRQGITVEALLIILQFGFEDLELHRVEACPLAKNEPSIKILEKLGFIYEGTLRQRIFFRGDYEDQLYYGLLREEWLPMR